LGILYYLSWEKA